MSDNQASAQSSATALAEEVKQQRARIQALEEQLARRDESRGDSRTGPRQLIDMVREVSDQRERDFSALGRALMLGSLEHVRHTARVLSNFVDRVERRDRMAADDPQRRPAQLADEVIDELLEAARESAAVQTQAVDRVLREYRDRSAATARGANSPPS